MSLFRGVRAHKAYYGNTGNKVVPYITAKHFNPQKYHRSENISNFSFSKLLVKSYWLQVKCMKKLFNVNLIWIFVSSCKFCFPFDVSSKIVLGNSTCHPLLPVTINNCQQLYCHWCSEILIWIFSINIILLSYKWFIERNFVDISFLY
jgi:hypothetical protein